MQAVGSYKDLIVWQKSKQLAVEVYRLSERFPQSEQYGLISQMRRAAVSIPSNIAEGSRRRGKDKAHLFTVAYSSGAELETQVEICKELQFIGEKQYGKIDSLLEEVMKMLNKLVNS